MILCYNLKLPVCSVLHTIDAAFRTGSVSDTKKLAVLYRADGSTGLSYQEMLKAIDDDLPGISLKGSPTVSPTTAALWHSESEA